MISFFGGMSGGYCPHSYFVYLRGYMISCHNFSPNHPLYSGRKQWDIFFWYMSQITDMMLRDKESVQSIDDVCIEGEGYVEWKK